MKALRFPTDFVLGEFPMNFNFLREFPGWCQVFWFLLLSPPTWSLHFDFSIVLTAVLSWSAHLSDPVFSKPSHNIRLVSPSVAQSRLFNLAFALGQHTQLENILRQIIGSWGQCCGREDKATLCDTSSRSSKVHRYQEPAWCKLQSAGSRPLGRLSVPPNTLLPALPLLEVIRTCLDGLCLQHEPGIFQDCLTHLEWQGHSPSWQKLATETLGFLKCLSCGKYRESKCSSPKRHVGRKQ